MNRRQFFRSIAGLAAVTAVEVSMPTELIAPRHWVKELRMEYRPFNLQISEEGKNARMQLIARHRSDGKVFGAYLSAIADAESLQYLFTRWLDSPHGTKPMTDAEFVSLFESRRKRYNGVKVTLVSKEQYDEIWMKMRPENRYLTLSCGLWIRQIGTIIHIQPERSFASTEVLRKVKELNL